MTMSQTMPVIVIDNRHVLNVPDPETIAWQCHAARQSQSRSAKEISGVALVGDNGAAYCWVKYGRSITMAEARTQDFVWQVLSSSNHSGDSDSDASVRVPCVYLAFTWGICGYIVMEHIDGETCENSDAERVATAVETLIAIQNPTLAPGPIGGGPIGHRFYIDWESCPVTYGSVSELQNHINEILVYMESKLRVDFTPEVEAYGLPLCPCDLNRNDFIKDSRGGIVAIDFGFTCFLPISFFAFALREGDYFTRLVAQHVKHPASTQLNAMLTASYSLVSFNRNDIGITVKVRNGKRIKVKDSKKKLNDMPNCV
ncbi:hypothetical protein BDN70DRAFT_101049 [Pholiota conissans]|uniref:Aminoglycoside phosphotransferase domain-containing protein n=1 Tax=Pholiota conissans TaxID=109636 RepID=A0A9P5Z0P6_9AGAR|nr:hypothetical protein BDN70DRAFT_101049 [Pholiota conissans]